MARSRAKSKGSYAPLAAQYYLDDAILEAGPHAELLWVRILSFLASVPSDGFITDLQLKAVGIGLRDLHKRVASLTEVGLLSAVPGGYSARSWLKWNRSVQEMGRIRTTDQARKSQNNGEQGSVSTRKAPQNGPDSNPQYSTVQDSTDSSSNEERRRPDIERLITLLCDLIEANGSKRPNPNKAWADAARLLIDKDQRPLGEAVALLRWCQSDEFWRANILSLPKFREKYDQLRLSRSRNQADTPKAREMVLPE